MGGAPCSCLAFLEELRSLLGQQVNAVLVISRTDSRKVHGQEPRTGLVVWGRAQHPWACSQAGQDAGKKTDVESDTPSLSQLWLLGPESNGHSHSRMTSTRGYRAVRA